MSIESGLVLLRDVQEFSVETAEFIALEVAKGGNVKELHEAFEDTIPSPLVINRWRKQYPAFDLVMREAEEAKAQSLADEIIGIADDDKRQSAQARNAIESRKWLAGQLSEGFNKGSGGKGAGGVVINVGQRLTDDQLMKIAQGGFIDGESTVVEKPESLVGPAVVVDTVEPEAVATDPGGRSDAADDGESVSGGGWDFI
jgi:hypothetical protein